MYTRFLVADLITNLADAYMEPLQLLLALPSLFMEQLVLPLADAVLPERWASELRTLYRIVLHPQPLTGFTRSRGSLKLVCVRVCSCAASDSLGQDGFVQPNCSLS